MPQINLNIENIINWFSKKFFENRYKSVSRWINYPIRYQDKIFEKLMRSYGSTLIWKWYDISLRSDYNKFCNIPIQNYDNIKHLVDQSLEGKSNILAKGRIPFFAKTSGTSSHIQKLIPITSHAIQKNHFKWSIDTLAYYVDKHPDTNIFSWKSLVIWGSQDLDKSRYGNYIADLSAILFTQMGPISQVMRVPWWNEVIISDRDKKVDTIKKLAINKNITYIAGIPSWINRLLEEIKIYADVPFLSQLRPELELYIHGGINFLPHKDQFEKLVGRSLNYIEVYNASEGFFGFGEQGDMFLATNHEIFYEFISLEEYNNNSNDRSRCSALRLQDIKPHIDYILIITTSTGLIRYVVGDVINFNSIYPFRFKIIWRVGLFLNAFAEHINIYDLERSIHEANKHFDINITDFTVTPIISEEKNYHDWTIEIKDHTHIDKNTLISFLDHQLMSRCPDYIAARNKILGKPSLSIVPDGIFVARLRSIWKIWWQYKVPKIDLSGDITEKVRSMVVK